MTVYIPVVGILTFLAVYMAVGLIAYSPLYRWSERFLAGDYRRWAGRNQREIWRGLAASSVAWPVILGYCIKTEISYRKKGYL